MESIPEGKAEIKKDENGKEWAVLVLENHDLKDKLFDMIEPGQVWRRNFGKGHSSNRLIHIRGKVDDRIIIRYWERARWIYAMETVWFFSVGIESGTLTLNKGGAR